MKSISDRAEVSVDFPNKTYMGAFGRESTFEVKVEPDEVMLRIVRPGEERREIAVHLHYFLLADILAQLGQGLVRHDFLDELHLDRLRAGADALARALADAKTNRKK
jgi:hypothetical protein